MGPIMDEPKKGAAMSSVGILSPDTFANSQTFFDMARIKVRNCIENYFDLTNASALETALKVISYATVVIPAIVFAIQVCLRYCAPIQVQPAAPIPAPILAVLDQAPQFRGYLIGNGINLTAATIRPANLFLNALLGENQTTLPGSHELFAILRDHNEVREMIFEGADDDAVVHITAGPGNCTVFGREVPLTQLYGENTCDISFNELRSILESQKIYTAALLPLLFYSALKEAMMQDGIVTLPGNGAAPVKVRDLPGEHCQAAIQQARENWHDYGFASPEICEHLLDLTIYQLGSLVVKTENDYLLTNPDGTIRTRVPGARDEIRLINACGIRGLNATPDGAITNLSIMIHGFRTALIAAESGYVVFPAVGMGVWGGDPDLYWRAFLNAVLTAGTSLEQIFVNPRHQTTQRGPFSGQNGSEFQTILNEFRAQYASNESALANLNKIVNLYDRQTDVLHLSQRLKMAFPEKIISLFNASDPDVTLGYHVGEYVNHLNHPNTTEENYTALGTNGLCFETITNVHHNPLRLIQT